MKSYDVKDIRTVGLFGHGGVGKTSVVENILHNAGQNSRVGSVDTGTSICDYDDEEKERKISISAAVVHYEWKDKKVHIIDTPGYEDFIGDVISAISVVDSALIAVCGLHGVEVRTSMVFEKAQEKNIPCAFFINRLDKENSDYYSAANSIMEEFGATCVPMQIPIGKEAGLSGIVSLLDESGKDKLDAEGQAAFDEYRSKLLDAVAEADDELIEKYLEGEELTREEVIRGLHNGVRQGKVFPILCGSAEKNIGIENLMDFISNVMPSPVDIGEIKGFDKLDDGAETVRKPDKSEPFAAYVFKSIADPFIGQLTFFKVLSGTLKADTGFLNINTREKERFGHVSYMLGKDQKDISEVVAGDIAVVAKLKNTHVGNTLCDEKKLFYIPKTNYPEPVSFAALVPKSKGDEDKIANAMHKLSEEDPTFRAERNKEIKQLIVSGMGDLHLDIMIKKMKDKFHVEVDLIEPKIAYRETIKGTAKAEYKHKKQSGGKGQYGHVYINMFPLERGEKFEFVNSIVGGSIPRQYIPAVEKGIVECMANGILAGYPVTDVKIELYDGSFHNVDSSELAFKLAGSQAFKKAFMDAKPVLLEPIMDVEIIAPGNFMGDITGNLNSKRGRIMGMDPKGKLQVVKAKVPKSEMGKYVGELRSMTSGRGTYSMKFSHYEEVPENLAQGVIAAAKKAKEEE